MSNELDERNKIIKSFFVIGLNESLIRKYENDSNPSRFVQDMDILIKELPNNFKSENKDEKYILLNEKKHVWLRIQYTENYNSPITDLQIAACEYESKEYLLLEKRYINENSYPMMVTFHKDNDEKGNKTEKYPIFSEFKFVKDYSEVYVKIPSELNIKHLIDLEIKAPCAIFLITRRYTSLPFKDICIMKKGGSNYNLVKVKNKSPYIYKYIPEILDQYPPEIEINSSVSMFCFPEGLHISDQYRMPIWFTFVLTDEIGNRTYGATLVFWEEMDIKLKENFIPFFDEYDPKTQKRKYYFIQKAICVLSKFPFYKNCCIFLKQLYRIQTASKSLIPLERAICTFVDSLYLQSQEIVQFIIGEEKLNFYKIANYGELWDTKNDYLEVLFRVLSFKQIVTAWQALLLEKKLFLLCSSKATLASVAHALINLLFPFKWIHVLIPILPEKLKLFIDTPIPLIIGISFPCDLNEFPNDAIILNINKNKFENYFSSIPKLKGKLQAILENKLRKLKEKYFLDNPIKSEKWMDFQDEAFPSFELEQKVKVDTTEIRDAFYSVFISIFKNYNKFLDWDNINQNLNNTTDQDDIISKCFKKKEFLKSHSAADENDFISLFSETSLFNQFFEPFLKIKTDGPMFYFLECIKNRKNDKKLFLQEIIPEKIRTLPDIDISDLKGQTFFHMNFPKKLEQNLYIKTEKPKKPFKSRFIKYQDEWCFDINKLKKREWPKYLLFTIYEIWFQFFSFIIHFYSDQESYVLMDYSVFLLEDLYENKRIIPTRGLFSKLFKSCGRSKFNHFVKRILNLVNKTYKNSKFSNLFCNSYLSGLYALTENIGKNNSITLASANSYLNISAIRNTILNEMYADNYDSKNVIENILFINAKICSNCILNKKKLYKIGVEKILAGFSLNKDNPYIICPECLCKIEPYIYYLNKSQNNNLKPQSFKLMHPEKLIQEVDKLINEEGELFFYKKFEDNKSRYFDLYLSIIFYFKLFDLPLLILYTPKNKGNNIINDFNEQIQLNKIRKLKKTEKNKHKNKNSVSPDRLSRSPDKSLDKKSYISGEYTDISRQSTLSNLPELEKEIWQNIQNNLNNEVIDNKVSTNEKNEFISRIKDIKVVISKYLEFFIFESNDILEKFLNKMNQKEEKEIELDFGNNLKLQTNINLNSNINILNKAQPKEKQRNIGGNNINIIDINKFNLAKKNKENNNETKLSEKFSGIFEEEKGEEKEINKKNNWMDKKNEGYNINIISEFDEFEDKKRKSSNNLSYKKQYENQTTSDKNKNEDLKEVKNDININEFKLEENKIENREKKEDKSDNEPIRKKSEIVKRKKKISITFE